MLVPDSQQLTELNKKNKRRNNRNINHPLDPMDIQNNILNKTAYTCQCTWHVHPDRPYALHKITHNMLKN